MTMTPEQKEQARRSAAKLLAEGKFSKIAAVHDSLKGSTIVYEDGTEETHGGRKTPEEVGKDKLAAAQQAAVADAAKAAASRFVWQPGDIAITNPDGTVVMTDTPTARPAEPLGPIPQGSESLEVWAVHLSPQPWERLGTIIREGGRTGTIVCTPESLSCLLRRPQLLGYDEMDYLTGWSNVAVAVWPKGEAPGAPIAF
jgi:hypothetical protein